MKRTRAVGNAFLLGLALLAASAHAASDTPGEKPFTVEYYYRVRLGHYDEWLDLYKRNHWPIMAAELKSGKILAYRMDHSLNSWPGDNRWDVRVSITWRNALVAHGLLPANREAILDKFKNRARHDEEEQRRMTLLDGSWDDEVETVETVSWPAEPR